MGYMIYVKDKTKTRFEKWVGTEYTDKGSAKQEIKRALKKYEKPFWKKNFGKPTFEIRKKQLKTKVKKMLGSSEWVRQQTQI